MPSEFIQRQIDGLLEQASESLKRFDWPAVKQSAAAVLGLDALSSDAKALLELAEGQLRAARSPRTEDTETAALPVASPLPEGEGQGEGRPKLQYHPQASLAGAGGSPALPGAGPASFAGGRYAVKRFLGEGGKKRVYLAHDNTLDRDVAFALIKTEGLDVTARERISREAQAMGRLGAHPNIVTVFDLGEEPAPGPHPDPLPSMGEGAAGAGFEPARATQPYMVTELMGGGDVEALIEQAPDHRVPLEQALAIAQQVCRGLEFAHGKGVVHRDLKPGNIWLTEAAPASHPSLPTSLPQGERGDGGLVGSVAKIGDFGLAVAIDRTRLTQAGMMVGTVSYMPPEQATGGEVTPRSDLYSLGAVLYELVTGRPPFVGDEAVAIIGQHLNTPPVAPSWHRPDCPPGLETLILRLLEKDPSKRPESAAEVRAALGIVAAAGAMNRAPTEDRRDVGAGFKPAYPGAATDAQTARDNPLYRRAFVGREGELRQLQAAFDAALSGKGALAMVVGEPGIGKTAVCEQLATYVALRGGKALVGHCYEEGSLSLPYLPFVEAMRSYVLAREPEGLKLDLGSGAGEVARIVSEVRDRVRVAPAETGDAEEQRWRLLQAVAGFLANASQVQPLLIILEDLHDADRGTLDLLVHLSRGLDGVRLLLVGTYRDVEVDRGHPLSNALAELRRGQNFLRVPLRGLTAEEVQRMMASVSQREIPWPIAELVHRQTEGNPLFVQEMLRYLVEEGLVAERGGSLRRVGDDSLAGRIPEGLRDVIGKRLSRLADSTNQVLSVAAVIGREFRLDVLQRVAGLPEEEVEAALEQAAGVAVVEQRQAMGTLGFRFTHAFFRQTLYEEIFVPRRIRLHQNVARALVTVYGRRADEHAAELAEHFAQTTDREDLEQALHYSRVAAERAMSVFAYAEAERHLNQALKIQEVLDPDDAGTRCDLLLALGEAILPGEDPRRAETRAAAEAFALAEVLQDSDRAARAATLALEALLRETLRNNVTGDEFRAWAERADRNAAPGTRERTYTDVCLFVRTLVTVGPIPAHVFLRRALDEAPADGDNGTYFLAAGWGLRNLLALQDTGRRRAIAVELPRRARQGVRSADLAVCLLQLGHAMLEGGDRAAAEHAWRELAELAGRSRDAGIRVMATEPGMALALLAGSFEAVESLYRERLLLGHELGSDMGVGAVLLLVVRAFICLGDASRALEFVEASGIAPRALLVARSLCLASLGRHDEARAARERFGDIASDADETAAPFLLCLLEAAVLGQDRQTVSALARRLAPLAACEWVGWSFVAAARVLGGGSALLGECDQARAYYQQALAETEKIRFRPEIALVHLELAELLLAHYPDEHATAIEHLDLAIAELREMKMQPALERALRHKDVLRA